MTLSLFSIVSTKKGFLTSSEKWLSTVPQFLYIYTTYSEIGDKDSDDDSDEELLADGEGESEDDAENVEQE